MIQAYQWGICRNLLQMKLLNLMSLFCLWAQKMRWTYKNIFLTQPMHNFIFSKREVCNFLKSSFESGFRVKMHFLNIFPRVQHFVCWFNLLWPSAKLQLVCRDLRWDTTSLKAHLCLLQGSILTDTGPCFLDEWTYLLSSSLRSKSLPTALQSQYLCWSAPENLSAYSKRITSINSLLQSLYMERLLQRVFQGSNLT